MLNKLSQKQVLKSSSAVLLRVKIWTLVIKTLTNNCKGNLYFFAFENEIKSIDSDYFSNIDSDMKGNISKGLYKLQYLKCF